jgi:hypothetical protein
MLVVVVEEPKRERTSHIGHAGLIFTYYSIACIILKYVPFYVAMRQILGKQCKTN